MKFLRKLLWPLWREIAVTNLSKLDSFIAYPLAIELKIGMRLKDAYVRGGKAAFFDEVEGFVLDFFGKIDDVTALQKGLKKRISYKLRYGGDSYTHVGVIEGITVARVLADKRNIAALGYGNKVKVSIDGKVQPIDAVVCDGAVVEIIEGEER